MKKTNMLRDHFGFDPYSKTFLPSSVDASIATTSATRTKTSSLTTGDYMYMSIIHVTSVSAGELVGQSGDNPVINSSTCY